MAATSTGGGETITPHHSRASLLLTIPLELRLQIYELVLADLNIIHRERRTYTSHHLRIRRLLQVCKAIRNESIGPFSMRPSAMLAEEEKKLSDAEEESKRSQETFAQFGTGGSMFGLHYARSKAEIQLKACENARKLISEERGKLRREGFQV
ncbi:hypothetical protein DOTSEDRAFT_18940 [Dothistroma septosporum NZE10]|uniref:Uncharacterized protein n=1 Tax=Dothistroma septosporum (strain NZE10 / CBS 128990) TaxID=675120 RepID=N1Q1M4_DOTSN|nr:hypothetical protein DOTSEDRAFT_18940 [Dothistroma septosporum NZE10]